MHYMKLILASQSTFRKFALDVLGLEYETIPSNFDESSIRHENSETLTLRLSEAKAKKIGDNNPDSITIAADLFVDYKNKIFEKPKDMRKARGMLKTLSGNTFNIVTGLAVYNSNTKKLLSTVEICEVKFRNLTDFEVSDYISRYPVLKCSAAFEADGLLRFAESVNGNYNFRTAIPMNKLIIFLRNNGIKV